MTRIDLDGDDAAAGLVALVVTVVELLVEALEREAIRRMESGDLPDEDVERLGRRLAAIEDELERLKEEEGVADDVNDLRGQLDGLVGDAIRRLDARPADDGRPDGDDRGSVGRTPGGRGGSPGLGSGGADPADAGGDGR